VLRTSDLAGLCIFRFSQARLLRQVDKGKLPEESYPYKICSSQRNLVDAMRSLKRGPNEVIVFIVGGEDWSLEPLHSHYLTLSTRLKTIDPGSKKVQNVPKVRSSPVLSSFNPKPSP
jgi:hypothetical protein